MVGPIHESDDDGGGLRLADPPLDERDRELSELGALDPLEPWEPPEPRAVDRIVPIVVDAVVVAAVVLFTLKQLQPRLLIADTTPAGGDMGAHVWGPAYLRDHLLPHLRLTGWTPDWYNGFPAYHFYMVIPALLIVVVNTGWQGWAALLPLSAALALAAAAVLRPRWRTALLVAAGAMLVFGVGFPYGVAFKFVTVAGVLGLPLAAYAFGRLARLPFPTPALLAVASIGFLFNREPLINNTGNIIGGNIASTLAGEFSFSLSLTFGLLYLGVLLRGLDNGRHRGLAAVLLALTALCHLIPAIFVAVATVVIVLVHWPTAARLRWLLTALPMGALLSAFWILPFWGRRTFLNDMGWETIPATGAQETVWDFLFPKALWAVALLALVGVVLSVVFLIRAGIVLSAVGALFGAAFILWPDDGARLWNARLLPFWLLCLFLLAGIGLAEVGRAVSVLVARNPDRPLLTMLAGTAGVGLLAMLVAVGLPLKALPFETERADGSYQWLWTTVSPADKNVVDDWARWNYSGYERKDAYPEYHELIATMDRIGEQRGCGRAFWEYENDRLNRYGTPMAPMLLPFWTDGCIGSQEGLYFESSATVPYHFLSQSALSPKPSRAQRDLPYTGFDIDLGVEQLQRLGVRYYLAFSTTAVQAADNHPDLEPIEETGYGWHIYEVADAPMVEPLRFEPAVVTGVEAHRAWLAMAAKLFVDTESFTVLVAADGPESWARISAGERPPTRRVDAVTVSDIEMGRDRIAFDVSEPGTPILVKTSYFPNWSVSGADGPYRVAPNLMVVVPTGTHVELTYGWTGLDISAYLLTGIGIIGLVLLARNDRARRSPPPRSGDTVSTSGQVRAPSSAVLAPDDSSCPA